MEYPVEQSRGCPHYLWPTESRETGSDMAKLIHLYGGVYIVIIRVAGFAQAVFSIGPCFVDERHVCLITFLL